MNWLLIVGIVVLGYFIMVPGANPFASDTTTTPAVGNVGGCTLEKVVFTPKMTELGNAGTRITESGYFTLTNKLGLVAAATTTDVPANVDLEVMFGENSSTYYTKVEKINTDCTNPLYANVELAKADTSLNSFYIKNSDGTVNGASNAEVIGANDVFEPTVTMKAGSGTYFGNPDSNCQNVAVVEYDKTDIKSVSGDSPAPVPGVFTYTNSTFDGSQAFYIPKTGDGSEVTFNMKIETTAVNPVSIASPILTIYDCDVDKNEKTLELIEGVEDESLNSISLAHQHLTIALS